jgi:hypothetical protein
MASTVLGSRLLSLAHRRDDCFGSGKPTGNKPLWVSAKVYRYPGIPVELLPTATYSYLTATESGAILVAGGQGRMRIFEGEALYAVVNGVFRP